MGRGSGQGLVQSLGNIWDNHHGDAQRGEAVENDLRVGGTWME
jgi:hypothetical protein